MAGKPIISIAHETEGVYAGRWVLRLDHGAWAGDYATEALARAALPEKIAFARQVRAACRRKVRPLTPFDAFLRRGDRR